jgi:hypothetical protein
MPEERCTRHVNPLGSGPRTSKKNSTPDRLGLRASVSHIDLRGAAPFAMAPLCASANRG